MKAILKLQNTKSVDSCIFNDISRDLTNYTGRDQLSNILITYRYSSKTSARWALKRIARNLELQGKDFEYSQDRLSFAGVIITIGIVC